MDSSGAAVHVVDDDREILSLIGSLLESVRLNIKRYAGGAAFLESFHRSDHPECVIMDLRMPGLSGLEVQEKLRERHEAIPIIFVTGYGDVKAAVQAMKNGAANFLEKPFHHQELLDSVQKAIRQDAEDRRRRREREQARARFASLTDRERQVLTSIVAGKPNKAVALDLHLSRKTVEIHRAHVMEKMGAASLVDLVKLSSIVG